MKTPLMTVSIFSVIFTMLVWTKVMVLIMHEWIIVGIACIELLHILLLCFSSGMYSMISTSISIDDEKHSILPNDNETYVSIFIKKHKMKFIIFGAFLASLMVLSIFSAFVPSIQSFVINMIMLSSSAFVIYIFSLPIYTNNPVLSYDISFNCYKFIALMILFIIHHFVNYTTFYAMAEVPIYLQFISLDKGSIFAVILFLISAGVVLSRWVTFLSSNPSLQIPYNIQKCIEFDVISIILALSFGSFVTQYIFFEHYCPIKLMLYNSDKTQSFDSGILTPVICRANHYNASAVYGVCLVKVVNGEKYISHAVRPPFFVRTDNSNADGHCQVFYRLARQKDERVKLIDNREVAALV